MVDRIKLLLETQNLTASQFAARIDVQRSSVSHIMSGRNKASLDFVQKILKKFPEISPDWLINGQGPMLRTAGSDTQKEIHSGKAEKSHRDLFDYAPEQQESQNNDEVAGKAFKDEDEPAYGKNTQPTGKIEAQVEKVIVFYEDGTFQSYSPAKRNDK